MSSIVLAALFFFASCTAEKHKQQPLANTKWTLSQYEDSSGIFVPVTYPHGKAGNGYWIAFRGDTIFGADNCNSIRGIAKTDDGKMQISNLISTLRGCPEALDMITALSLAKSYEVHDAKLSIHTAHSPMQILIFERL